MIIQNAIKIQDGEEVVYLQSTHRHDFQQYTYKNGAQVFVDGGVQYIRRGYSSTPDGSEYRYQDWSLAGEQPIAEIAEKLLWGTRGKHGNEPLIYKPLCELSQAHLKSILKTQKQIKGTIHEKVIKYLLTKTTK